MPVLNDDEELSRLLSEILVVCDDSAEIIVVDGSDSRVTRELSARDQVKYVQSPPSRGAQISEGISVANGKIIWIIHADSRQLTEPLRRLRTMAKDTELFWGRFDVSMESLKLIPFMMNLRSRLTKICTGDQGMFFSSLLLGMIGGFPNLPLMEDIELSRQLKMVKDAKFYAFRDRLIASERKWIRNGILRTVLQMWSYRLRYFFGGDARSLYRDYYKGGW